jgi:hypothetical protein
MSDIIRVRGGCIGDVTINSGKMLSSYMGVTPDMIPENLDTITLEVNNAWDIKTEADRESMLLYILRETLRLKHEKNFNFCSAQFVTTDGQRYAHLSGFFKETRGENVENINCLRVYEQNEQVMADLIFS